MPFGFLHTLGILARFLPSGSCDGCCAVKGLMYHLSVNRRMMVDNLTRNVLSCLTWKASVMTQFKVWTNCCRQLGSLYAWRNFTWMNDNSLRMFLHQLASDWTWRIYRQPRSWIKMLRIIKLVWMRIISRTHLGRISVNPTIAYSVDPGWSRLRWIVWRIHFGNFCNENKREITFFLHY